MADNRSTLVKEYRKLAKRADQRLVRLEAYAQQSEYKGVLNFAYAKAQTEIRRFSGENAKRFNTKPPENTNQLKAKIKAMESFLQSETSTLQGSKKDGTKGIIGVYKKRANTLNEKYGLGMDWKQLANFFEKGTNALMDNMMDSKTKMKVLATIKANEEEIKRQIEAGEEIHIQADDKLVEHMTKEFLNINGLDINKLFKG